VDRPGESIGSVEVESFFVSLLCDDYAVLFISYRSNAEIISLLGELRIDQFDQLAGGFEHIKETHPVAIQR